MLRSASRHISLPHTLALIVVSALMVVGVAWTSDILLVQRSLAVRVAESSVAKKFGLLTDLRRDLPRYVTMDPPVRRPREETTWPTPIPCDCRIGSAAVNTSVNFFGASIKHIVASASGPSGQPGLAGVDVIESGVPFRALRRANGEIGYYDIQANQFVTTLQHGEFRVTRTAILPTDPIWQGLILNVIAYFFCFYLSVHVLLRHRFWRRIRNGLCPRCRYVISSECNGCAECGWLRM